MKDILSNIKAEFCRELDCRDYPYTNHAVETILDEWYDQKKSLIDLLSKHPNWNPEKFMIQFDTDFSRKIEYDEAMRFLLWLDVNTDVRSIVTKEYKESYLYPKRLFHSIRDTLLGATYIPENMAEILDEINALDESFRFRPGMKVTKVMRKICEHYGWTKITKTEYDRNGDVVTYNAFERAYAKYCDAMSPLKVTRHTCISVNPIDYLLMSNGNSWRSCHYIDNHECSPGEYSSGTISYMLDEHSIVFYTVDASYNGNEIERTAKIQRQIFGYNDFQIMQSRLYPQSNDNGAENVYEDFRGTMQKVIADCLEKPNLWMRRRHKLNVNHGSGATCYPDWRYGDLCSTSVLKEKREMDLKAIVLGAMPICIECGQRHDIESNINHCRNGLECYDCGCHLYRGEYVELDGEYYCHECVSFCDSCEDYHRGETYYIPSEDRYVCEYCLDEYYRYCNHCGEYHHVDDVTWIEDESDYVCDHCLWEYYVTCCGCDEWIRKRNANAVVEEDGVTYHYCDCCYEVRMEEDEDNE